MSRRQILQAGTRFVSDHHFSGPVLLGTSAAIALLLPIGAASWSQNAAIGTGASLTLIAVFVSTAGLGAIVRRAGRGRAGFVLAAVGLVTPLLLAILAFNQDAPANGGCSSCLADGLFFGTPWLLAMLLTPMAIGYRRASRDLPEGSVA
jgi:hypothetical protein